MDALATATASFERTLDELGISALDEELDAVGLGRRAALLAAGEILWRRHIGPTYTTKHVRELMSIGSRQAVSERVKRNTLLALPGPDRRPRFPAFQFTNGGRPLPALSPILELLSGVVESPYTIASWFVTPEPLLDGKSPADWLRDGRPPARALEAASRYAERLRH